jgi:hypothetical protein
MYTDDVVCSRLGLKVVCFVYAKSNSAVALLMLVIFNSIRVFTGL